MAVSHPTVGMPTRARATRALAVGAALVTITLTAAAFWLSYAALHDLAIGHHLAGARAWAWPATLDSFIAVGELLVLRSALRRCLDWFAICLVAAGSVGSIVLNVVSVGARVDATTQVVAAIPPTAALLAFTALMRQIYRALTGHPTPSGPGPERASLPHVEESLTPVVTAVATPAIPPMPAQPPTRPTYATPALEAIRELYNGGYRPGTESMRSAVHAATGNWPGGSTCRQILRAAIEAIEPHLAMLPPEPTKLAAVAP